MSKSYWIRTFGCQMNEHDSERMAGLLEVQGYRPAPSAEQADVVIFNTCAIRENADNRLYGNLGHVASVQRDVDSLGGHQKGSTTGSVVRVSCSPCCRSDTTSGCSTATRDASTSSPNSGASPSRARRAATCASLV